MSILALGSNQKDQPVRLHIQNPPDNSPLAITKAQWEAALTRHPDLPSIDVSIGESEAEFWEGIAAAEVLLTWVNVVVRRLPRGTLPAPAPRLKLIHCNSAGVDRLAPFDWLPDGIALINNSGMQTDKAGEFGIMALLMLQNRMPALIEAQRSGTWSELHGTTLDGRTLCVVGTGAIGSGVARRARAFGMRVIGVRNGNDPHPDFDEIASVGHLEQVLPRVDDLLLACPLTNRTRNLLSRDRIALLPKGARALNLARGAVWDQDAVCDALDAGHLESAFTDVAVPEPLPPHHRLWKTPGMIVTPHISADDRERYNDQTLDILFENLRAAREGKPLPNKVDPIKGY